MTRFRVCIQFLIEGEAGLNNAEVLVELNKIDSKRNVSIDTLKFLSIVAVIIIHVGPSYHSGPRAVEWVQTACGLAVPLFFIASGYFFGKTFTKGVPLKTVYMRYLKRLLIIFLGWSVIYSLPRWSSDLLQSIVQYGWIRTYYWYYTEVFQFKLIYFLMGGTAAHLWFLSALIQAITIITTFLLWKKEKFLIYFSLFLYLLMPVVNLYVQVGFKEDYRWNPVVGPFVATAFVVSGWWLSKIGRCSLRWAAALIVMGIIGSWAHERVLVDFYNISPAHSNYGSLLVATGIFIAALSCPRLCEHTLLPRLGQLTLGVYCSHILFVDLFKMFKDKIDPLAWDFIVPILIYLMALGLTLLLKQIPCLRKLVI